MARGSSMARGSVPSGRGRVSSRQVAPAHGFRNGGSQGSGHGGSHGSHGGWHGGHGWNWRWGWGWAWRGSRWGWGWGWGWGYPGYYPGYYGVYYGGYGAPYGGGYAYAPGDWGAVKTDVAPEEARVLLDGRYIGTADDFDGYPDFLYLKPGKYRLEFQLEGFETQSVDIEARPGVKIEIDNKLKKIPGAKQYGSYDTPEPQGGVQRFFGKEKDQTTAINVEADSYEDSGWRDRGPSGSTPDSDQEAPPQAPPPDKSYEDAPPPDRESGSRPPVPVPGGKSRIVFRVEPPDAAVYVDDRFAGTGEELSSLTRGMQVAPGMHKIVVSRPGFSTESTQLDATAGQSETVEITLDRR